MAITTIDDINSFLPPNVVTADEVNTASIVVNVERYIKAYLAKVVVTSGWTTPDVTPSTVQLVASMLSAAQLFFNSTGASSLDVDDRSYAQVLYDRAIELLHGIVDGTIDIDGDNDGSVGEVSKYLLTFWPDNTTEPKFMMDMQFG